ncbi:tetratricopeptide repeat protein [Rhizobium sp. Leaf341]|uniref:tetratricopeptide repeat protein n=1 Tax=Rhizobium sp. Leaf341 TaxID=1736344 RepID=UPI0007157576|nr:tetratricopeptide repeat protein [Rhizobium sp. Leaf341]KQR75846.1 enhanced entry protein [Rhizobium sp. Leaf341]
MLDRSPRLCLLSVALLSAGLAGLPARAQDALPGVDPDRVTIAPAEAPTEPGGVDPDSANPMGTANEPGRTAKRGRITPFNGAVLPDNEIPALRPPGGDVKPADGKIAPSGGVNVLERMGAALPALPAEKPFEGKADDAYGAFQRGYYLTAMELALPRAQLGDAAAQTLVAEIFSQGLGVPRKPKDAAFWYGQAAASGDPTAMFKYAILLMEGRDVPRDKARSEELMKKAAERGNPSAQFNHAQLLVADQPGQAGLKAALPFYEKSAQQGIADAQYALSQIYLNVDGIPDDKRERAREWLLRAAAAGVDTAQLDAGIWLVDGIGGGRDLEKGFGWMLRAANAGNVVAQNKLAHLYINAIGTRPNPVEAAKWYVLSRRAGLKDDDLEDFYLGIGEDQQKAAREAANRFRAARG